MILYSFVFICNLQITYYAKLFSSSEDVENRKIALTHLDEILKTSKEKFNSAHVKNVFEQAAVYFGSRELTIETA